MPRLGIVGPSYPASSPYADAERSVNWFPVPIESGAGRTRYMLENTPGYKAFCDLSGDQVRGVLTMNNGRCLAVCDDALWEVFIDGTKAARGSLTWDTGLVSIVQGQNQVLIVEPGPDANNDLGAAWILALDTNTLTEITNDLVGNCYRGVYSDGYFAILIRFLSKFQISSLLDGLTWDAGDVAESSLFPDQVVGMEVSHREIWMMGSKSTGVYRNTGNPDFPFEPIVEASIQHGCISGDTLRQLDNTLFWLEIDPNGRPVVMRAQGFLPQRVSNHAVENALNAYAQTHPIVDNDALSQAFAYTWQEKGHSFYKLTVPGMETSWVFNIATNLWHEEARWDGAAYSARTEWCHAYGLDRHLVGRSDSGILYEASMTIADDAGDSEETPTRIIDAYLNPEK